VHLVDSTVVHVGVRKGYTFEHTCTGAETMQNDFSLWCSPTVYRRLRGVLERTLVISSQTVGDNL
jgi:hypothetical protein